MIKIFGFIVFLAAFIWTWTLFNSKTDLSIATHANLQSKLSLYLEEVVKKQKPEMENFKLIKIYTEKIDAQKIKAYFEYQFDSLISSKNNPTEASASESPDSTSSEPSKEVTTQNLKGEAVLNKSLGENTDVQKWYVAEVKINNESIDFKEGLTLTTSKNNPEPTKHETPSSENHAEPKSETK